MKKILFLAVLVGIAFGSCKKEEDVKPVKVEKKVMDGEDDGGGKVGQPYPYD